MALPAQAQTDDGVRADYSTIGHLTSAVGIYRPEHLGREAARDIEFYLRSKLGASFIRNFSPFRAER